MLSPAGERFLRSTNPKQRQICALLVEEVANKAIAWRIGTTEQVVKNYMRRMFDLTGVDSRLEFVLWLIRHGVLPCPCEKHDENKIP